MTDYSLTLAQRWEAEQRAADALDPWRDFTRVLSRDAAGNLRQSPRTAPAAERVDQATYDRMTYPEKMAYAAKFNGGK